MDLPIPVGHGTVNSLSFRPSDAALSGSTSGSKVPRRWAGCAPSGPLPVAAPSFALWQPQGFRGWCCQRQSETAHLWRLERPLLGLEGLRWIGVGLILGGAAALN